MTGYVRCVTIVLAAALACLAGCGDRAGVGELPPRTTSVTQDQAVEIAKTTVQERDAGLARGAAYEASPEGNGWLITVQSGKSVRLIILDAEGKVFSYSGQ
jgi:uncharacterized lipoprotein YajG